MSWGISENATDKEKFWADINDTLKGFNSTTKIDYQTYSELYDELRKQFDLNVGEDFKKLDNSQSKVEVKKE